MSPRVKRGAIRIKAAREALEAAPRFSEEEREVLRQAANDYQRAAKTIRATLGEESKSDG